MFENESISNYEIVEDDELSNYENIGSDLCCDLLDKYNADQETVMKELCNSIYDKLNSEIMETFIDSDRVNELENTVALLKQERANKEKEELNLNIDNEIDNLINKYDELHEEYNIIKYELKLECTETKRLETENQEFKSKRQEYDELNEAYNKTCSELQEIHHILEYDSLKHEDYTKLKDELANQEIEKKELVKHISNQETEINELTLNKNNLLTGIQFLERENSILIEDTIMLENRFHDKELEIDNLHILLDSSRANTSKLDLLAEVCSNEVLKEEFKSVPNKRHRYNLRSRPN